MRDGRAIGHDHTVSVIVPTVSQAAHLAACLAALRQTQAPDTPPLDIIVVLNGATPDVRDVARATPGIRIVESPVNRGFAGGCHLGVRASRARWLAFLNDDVRVTPGWLAPLLETLAEHPRAGVVGPRVLGADGAVQEIGSVIWRDGTTRPLGRGLPASSVAWRWRRRLDYASACAVVVRRDAWDAVGGFDQGYHPAYYEDVDFCLALEAAGYETWVDPRADVVHAESASTGRAFKAFLFERHHARLVERWGARLGSRVAAPMAADDVAAAEQAAVARLQPPGPRVLVVDDRVPQHGIGSGFDRMADAILDLAAGGARVRCLATEFLPDFVPSLAAAGVEVLDGPVDALLARELAATDVVLVSRPNNARRVHEALRRMSARTRPRYVYDAEALYHRRVERQAALHAGVAAEVLRGEAADWCRAETQVASRADLIVCVSKEEADFFTARGAASVRVLTPWLRRAGLTPGSLEGRADIGFVAGWLGGAASPNGDGLEWFVTEILPRITAVMPWVRLRVTGTLPPPLRRLEGLNVRAEGFVQDLPGFYRQLRVAIAPLRFGAGVKLKTLEALQHGVPIVSTTVGAEGLASLPPDAVVVYDDAQDFAAAVVARLADAGAWRSHRRAIETTLRQVTRDTDWVALVTGAGKAGTHVHHEV